MLEQTAFFRRVRSDRLVAVPNGAQAMTAVVYLALYVLLDWLSYVEPFGAFAITPWNPATGLSLALIVLLGRSYCPLLFLAPLLADALLRGWPAPLHVELVLAGILGGIYCAAGTVLAPRLQHERSHQFSFRSLLLVVGGATVFSAVAATLYVGTLVAAGLIGPGHYSTAATRLWIGDLIGIVVVVPLLVVLVRGERFPNFGLDTALEVLAIVGALTIIRNATANAELHVFYVLFIPVVWIAVRHGIEGSVLAITVAQIGLMISITALSPNDVDITTFQAKMLVLALTGLVVGVAISDRNRAEEWVRQQREAQSRLARLGSIGELSVSLAHEINQPLAAATTYAALAAEELDRDDPRHAAALEPLSKCASQVKRAADVVRRLRDHIKHGSTAGFEPHGLCGLVDEALSLLAVERQRAAVVVERDRMGELALPPAHADAQQITQVLINILSNAFDALEARPDRERVVSIEARDNGDGFLEVRIEDTGPGFAAEIIANPFMPLRSEKPFGLGLGLALCRSIVQAHGGDIRLDNGRRGAIVRFTLSKAQGERS